MKTLAIATILALLIPAAGFAQTLYTQDFETLSQVDGQLAADGWLVYGNIFDAAGNYLWGHGPWAAPNNIGNWCDIVDGEGGSNQDIQQLVMYSDYANGDQATGNLIESNLFQEQVLPVGCSGIWTFTFDAKMGNLGGNSTAAAFIKILDPNAGWSTTLYDLDMTNTPGTWTDYEISVDVAGLDGQILQFGFMTTVANFEPSGVFYDNVAFSSPGVVPSDDMSWDKMKSLFR